MNRSFIPCLIIAFLMLVSLASAQSDYSESNASEALRDRAYKLEKSLRCVVCQNQPISSSNAPLAADMRRIVEERLAAGDSDEEVVEFLVERYGSFVLLKPPLQMNTLFLWFGPLLFVILAALGWRAYARPGAGTNMLPAPLSDEEIEQLRHLQSEDAR